MVGQKFQLIAVVSGVRTMMTAEEFGCQKFQLVVASDHRKFQLMFVAVVAPALQIFLSPAVADRQKVLCVVVGVAKKVRKMTAEIGR